MERRPEDIFRVHDLSVLKSPMPAHLLGGRRTAASPTTHTLSPVRPTPKQMSSPFGLSALTIHTPGRGAPTVSLLREVIDKTLNEDGRRPEAPATTGVAASADAPSALRVNADAPNPNPNPPSSALSTMEELLKRATTASKQEPTSQLSLVDDELKRQWRR